MKSTRINIGFCVIGLFALAACQSNTDGSLAAAKPADPQAPNVLLIVVDDLGFAELGAYGSEIPTPNLDGLANNGVKFSNFHVAPTCSPTRSMLLSGTDNHIAGLGNMFEELSPNQKGKKGYEGYLHERVAPLPAIFREAGYQTFMSGKWHLGLEADQGPLQRGFDKAFALLEGGAGHFDDMQSLFETEVGNFGKAKYRENGEMLDNLPEEFDYSTEFYVDRLLQYLQAADSEKPFFAYLAFTAPHWPLQAPPEAIARHEGRYALGYDELARQRLQRQKALGLLPANAELSERPYDAPTWDSLSEEEQRISARRMEIYAAMVDEIDRHTGRLLNYLRESGQFDNTIIVFMSDNGAEGHTLSVLFAEEHFPAARNWVYNTFAFDYDSMGGPGSYVMVGPGWGWAGAPALRGYKGATSQGGTRVPAFVHYPRLAANGRTDASLLSVKDVAPTLLELAGIAAPDGEFLGRNVEPITGESFVDVLQSKAENPARSQDRVLGVELFGKRGIRQGDWSLVHMFEPYGNNDWQLYNLRDDLAERLDLADKYPQKLAEMQGLWEEYAQENGVILPDWNSGY